MAKIPFVPDQRSGGDPLAGASPIALNVVVDAAGAVRRRPVIVAEDEAPVTAIDANGLTGVHVTAAGRIIVVGGPSPLAKIYEVAGGNAVDLSTTTSRSLAGGRRPTFAETEALVAIAAGANVQKVLLEPIMVSSRLGGSPPMASHVIAHRSRLLVNNLTGNLNFFTYSDLAAGSSYAGHEVWIGGTSGDVSADARPGPLVALWETSDEVIAFGESNVESFAPDPTLIYVRSGARENGCLAPYSVARVDGGFAWLDHSRRFVLSDGRSVSAISLPAIQETLAKMTVLDDCHGSRVQLGAMDALVWRFGEDGRTFVFSGGMWSQWSGEGVSAFIGNAYATRGGNVLVGTTTGRLGRLSSVGAGDLGGTVTSNITTGFLTQGTGLRKHCQGIRVMMRRGHGYQDGELHLSYRDNEGPWMSPLVIPLGKGGDRDVVVSKRSLGTYRTRQWRATFSGAEDFLLVGVEEDFVPVPD